MSLPSTTSHFFNTKEHCSHILSFTMHMGCVPNEVDHDQVRGVHILEYELEFR